MKLRIKLVSLLALLSMTVVAQEKLPAFPGAEGFGRFTTGGRGGKVYHVTNLNDSGNGSLRWANSQSGPRTIVVDVSGTIYLKSALRIAENTTLAGQTAPGDGICIANYPVTLGKNNIIRYVRFRLGNEALKTNPNAHEGDGLGAMDSENIIVDHCSVSWSIDECLSVYGSKNITVQWSISSQSLVNSGHSKGAHGYGGNWGGSGASYHHNLIAHHTSRTPRLGPRPGTQTDERMDMRNNVIYNFGGNGCYGGEGMNVNIVNNYYKPGPGSPTGTKGMRIAAPGIRTTSYTGHGTNPNSWDVMWHVWGKYYVDGNVNTKYDEVTKDNWTYGIYNQIDENGNDGTYTAKTRDTIRITEPIHFLATTTQSAQKAFEKVMDYVGASLHRDAVDAIIIDDARNGKASYTGSGNGQGFINSQDDLKKGIDGADSPWPTLKQTAAPKDTDGDGMPDDWETANGLNPNNAADGKATAANGFTNLENYMNSLVADITAAQNESGVLQGEALPGENQSVSYILDATTYQESQGDTWYFKDDLSISAKPKSSYLAASYKFDTFRAERNKQHTIYLPNDVAITSVSVSGYCNGTGTQTSYLSELNGTEYSASQYKFPNRSNDEAATYRIALSDPAKDRLTYTTDGDNNTCLKLELNGTKGGTTGIAEVQTICQHVDNTIYNLQGVRVDHPTKGIYIQNHKKIIIK